MGDGQQRAEGFAGELAADELRNRLELRPGRRKRRHDLPRRQDAVRGLGPDDHIVDGEIVFAVDLGDTGFDLPQTRGLSGDRLLHLRAAFGQESA